ncbi:hypothetical protein [Amycolatopsis suaedae]|uniref:hypothetical protein n=1 Tax=Amycolatopsis suaedae TaxID=2510978 RepID=UPI001F10F9CD|nr:hypothetical protein [Amycolatopsis suaedae]
MTESDAAEDRDPARTPKLVFLGSMALAVAAVVVAGIFGVQWALASGDDNAALARSRDDVARAATTAVKAFTEFDHADLGAYFARQREIAAPQMIEQINKSEETYRKAITEAKTSVVTTVQDVAVEELDNHKGEASVLAAISTEVSKGADKGVKSLRLELTMSRVGEDWKLTGIGNVPIVGATQ